MSRTLLPSIFSLSWTLGISDKEGPGIHLRWMLRADAGLPRAHFLVWINPSPKLRPKAFEVPVKALSAQNVVLDWGPEPLSFLSVRVDLTAGQRLTLRAYEGSPGISKLIDEDTRTSTGTLLVYGGRLQSAMLSGSGEIVDVSGVTTDSFINDPNWRLVERVGLPVDEGWSGTGYPVDPQGRLYDLRHPTIAARQRIENGGPTRGWAANNDRGQAMPAWAPATVDFVDELRKTVLPGVHEMLGAAPQPEHHVEYQQAHAITAPESIHGDQAAGKAVANVAPLGALLTGAASDPFAALGLGFGTFLPLEIIRKYAQDNTALSHVGNLTASAYTHGLAVNRVDAQLRGLVMVTVEHELPIALPPLQPGDGPKYVRWPITLADVAFHPVTALPPDPVGLAAERHALDRPEALDQPFMESVVVSWNRPVQNVAEAPIARSYAISSAIGSASHELLLAKRWTGGHRPWVPTQPVDQAAESRIHDIARGLREPEPSEPPGVVLSVAAQDWFGRWSEWGSVDFQRSVTLPQTPALMRVELLPLGGDASNQSAAVDVELTWNWADRSPEVITIEVKLHREGTPVPAGNGSILGVGGPLTAAATINFAGSPVLPAGIEHLVDDPPIENLTRYRVRVTGLQLDFAAHPRITASVRIRATEHVRPAVVGSWSRTLSSSAASPVPPPRPVVPPGMVWSSLPDARGFARASLVWPTSPGIEYVLYAADETSLRRELAALPGGFPSADLRERRHIRLLALRNKTAPNLRRAFRRIADGIALAPYEVELPKGSKLIHFYVLLARSETGVESPFPTNSNEFLAVATPRAAIPQPPRVHARPVAGGVRVEVMIDRGDPLPAHVDLHRTAVIENSTHIDRMGAAISSSSFATPSPGWTIESNTADGVRLWYLDTTVPEDWTPRWYRAVAWTASNPTTGELAARSDQSPDSAAARRAAGPPELLSATASREAGRVLARWTCTLPLLRTPLGVAAYNVSGRTAAAEASQRLAADAIATFVGPIPEPGVATAVFRHHLSSPSLASYCAWLDLPAGPAQVIIQAVDPVGRTATALVEVP